MKKLLLPFIAVVLCLMASYHFFYSDKENDSFIVSEHDEVGPPKPKEVLEYTHIVDSLNNLPIAQLNNVFNVTDYLVSRGDTFSKILRELNVDSEKVGKLSTMIHGKLDMSLFKIGQLISIYTLVNENSPFKLQYNISNRELLDIDVRNLKVDLIEKPISLEVKRIESMINTSLVRTVTKNGASEDLADKVLSLFVWEVDFKKLNATDSLFVIYEDLLVEGKSIATGKILAASFYHGEKKLEAYYFENDEIKGYFDQNGQNISRAPLEYDIISSLYSKRRYHPVKRRYRAHLGVDFMADVGVAVEALADGIITRARFGRANGNYVKIKHEGTIATQYLHLSKISTDIKEGMRIKKGQIIGEVGSTGLSSGPHLCLRLWKNGRQIDPLSYQWERRAGIPMDVMDEFKASITNIKQ